MTPDTEPASPAAPRRKKPRLSFLLATWFGAGYLPRAPGTWGSLAGLFLTFIIQIAVGWKILTDFFVRDRYVAAYEYAPAVCCFVLAAVGVSSSSRVAAYSGKKDPQFVVIDEVSGQMLTLVLGAAPVFSVSSSIPLHTPWGNVELGEQWVVLAAGFLLFRLFDIWKPFPIRHLEKLPGGWGIMADDWLAGIYAAILLRLALHFNLL
jgi:phosphatidylglycerophosphatase A